MIARRPCRVPVPHAALALVLALLMTCASQTGSGFVAAQSDACHYAYGGCLPIVEDLNCDDIEHLQVEVWNVDDDPYGLDDSTGPGNGITCDGVGDDGITPANGNDAAMGIMGGESEVVASGLTDEERAYLDQVVAIMEPVRAGLTPFFDLMRNEDLGNDRWTEDVISQLTVWRTAYTEAAALTPPQSLHESHALLVQGLYLLTEAADDIEKGMDREKAAPFDKAAEKLDQAVTSLAASTDLLCQLRAERGVPCEEG